MAYESAPVPLPTGSLEPPRRVPPTAVGLMDEASHGPRRGRYPAGPTLVRRVALRALAAVLLVGSAAALWPLGWQSSVGAGLMSLSVHVAHRSLVSRSAWRYVDVENQRTPSAGDSSAPSA